MPPKIIIIKRSELYNQVWSVPMRTLAQQYGLSHVGLAKICKKHAIPHPPRGYWAKAESRRKPRQIPLPRKDAASRITPLLPESYAFRYILFL
jgi:hypothetical protein